MHGKGIVHRDLKVRHFCAFIFQLRTFAQILTAAIHPARKHFMHVRQTAHGS